MERSIKSVSSSWNLELIRYQSCLKNFIIKLIRLMRNNSMTTEIKINCYIYCILCLFTYLIKRGNVTLFKFHISKNALVFNIYNYVIGTFILFHYNKLYEH